MMRCSSLPTIFFLELFVGLMRGYQKKFEMPLIVPCTRYSLVKGERIVRSELSRRLYFQIASREEFIYASL